MPAEEPEDSSPVQEVVEPEATSFLEATAQDDQPQQESELSESQGFERLESNLPAKQAEEIPVADSLSEDFVIVDREEIGQEATADSPVVLQSPSIHSKSLGQDSALESSQEEAENAVPQGGDVAPSDTLSSELPIDGGDETVPGDSVVSPAAEHSSRATEQWRHQGIGKLVGNCSC